MMESIFYMLQGAFFQHIGRVIMIAVPVYSIILLFKIFSKKRKNISLYRCIVEFMLLGYIITVLSITDILSIRLTDLSEFNMAPNLVPLVNTISDLMSHPASVVKQILLNVAFFIPFGVLFTLLYMKNRKILLKTILVAIVFSTSIETLEYFVGRYMDIDDVIWNTLGAVIGSNISLIASNILKKNKKEKVVIA